MRHKDTGKDKAISNYCWGTMENLANEVNAYSYEPEVDDSPRVDEQLFDTLDDYFEKKYLSEVQEIFKPFVVR